MRAAEWVRSFEGRARLQLADCKCRLQLGPQSSAAGLGGQTQAANAACRGLALAVFVREIRKENLQNTQGPGPSADPRLQMQIAACGGEGSCRAGDRVCRFQIANTDCSTQPRGGLQRQG